jgi:hypothetical protein
MRKRAFIILAAVLLSIPAYANKVAEVKYSTSQPIEKVYAAALRTIALQGYAVRFTDPKQGTIQANKTEWAGQGEWASVIITMQQEGDRVTISAIFTRNMNTVRGGQPPQWAKKFGDELKKSIPDLS